MRVAAAVTDACFKDVRAMPQALLQEYDSFGQQCFTAYWGKLQPSQDEQANTAFTPAQLVPVVGGLFLRLYRAVLSKRHKNDAALRRAALEKAEVRARQELRELVGSAATIVSLPVPVLACCPEECAASGVCTSPSGHSVATAAAAPLVQFTASGEVVEDEAVLAHEAGFRPGSKCVASPRCADGVAGKTGVVQSVPREGIFVLWDGLSTTTKHSASVLEGLRKDPEEARLAKAEEALRKKGRQRPCLAALPGVLPQRGGQRITSRTQCVPCCTSSTLCPAASTRTSAWRSALTGGAACMRPGT